jgi:hypothetical protein
MNEWKVRHVHSKLMKVSKQKSKPTAIKRAWTSYDLFKEYLQVIKKTKTGTVLITVAANCAALNKYMLKS